MNPTLTPVAPARPAAPYVGGKRNLARRITALIETVEHQTYAEPFCGMGGVFLRRRHRPASEVINDLSGDVSNFFRVLQAHPDWFQEMIAYQVSSRREFVRLQATDPNTLTDIQRAARFLYLQRMGFGGTVTGRPFGVDPGRPGRFNVEQLRPVLEALHRRLAGVVIENLDWSAFLGRYDRPKTLFYLDPPYWGSERMYGADLFDQGQFQKMADQLAEIRGRFILSINDRPEIREVFARFRIEAVTTTYTVGPKAIAAGELIISNLQA